MRNIRPSQAVFAVTLLLYGIFAIVKADFAPPWDDAPKTWPARDALAYLCDFISIAAGVGLLWHRASAFVTRVLLACLLLWMLLVKVRFILIAPTVEGSYQSWGETAVIAAGAWVLYVWSAPTWDRRRLGFVARTSGLVCARIMYALAMIAFGLSHFAYLELTAPLIPVWLPWHVALAYFTGGAYLAAGVAIIVGFCARWAAALSALQMALITVIVWIPLALAGGATAFQWREFALSWLLTTAGWIVADSYSTRAAIDPATTPQ